MKTFQICIQNFTNFIHIQLYRNLFRIFSAKRYFEASRYITPPKSEAIQACQCKLQDNLAKHKNTYIPICKFNCLRIDEYINSSI